MRWILFLPLFVAPLSAATVNCTNNPSSDPSSVQQAVNSGGTVTITGTCNFSNGGVTVNSAVTIVGGGSSPTINGNSSNSGFAFTVNADGVSVTGITFNNGIGAAHLQGIVRKSFNFSGNTVEYTDNVPVALLIDDIIRFSNISNNNWLNIGPANLQSQTYGSMNCSGSTETNCESAAGMAIGIFGGIDNTTIQYNTANWLAKDWLYLTFLDIGNDAFYFLCQNISISYNSINHYHRMGFEIQGTGSYPYCSRGSTCDLKHLWFTGLKIAGNYTHNPFIPYDETFAFSIVPSVGDGQYINNSAINETTASYPLSQAGMAADAFEDGWHTVLSQGNVASGIPSTNGVTQGVAWGGGMQYGYNIFPSLGLYTTQNNILCSVGAADFGTEGNGTANAISQYNYTSNTTTNNCPGAPTPYLSSISFAFAGSSTSGGNVTWRYSAVSNLSLRYVQYFLDGSSIPVATQEVQDVSTTFASDLKWLYHETLPTSGLSSGAHVMTAVVTDVSGATRTNTQSFTLGSGGGGAPQPAVSPGTAAFGTLTVGTQSNPSTVTLSNSGTTAFTLSALTLTGSNRTDFVATDSACGTSVAAGASCSISVKFTPGATGPRSATLNIPTSATTLSVSLTGTGAAASAGTPTPAVSPTAISFGTVTVGTASSPTTAKLSNTGTAAFTLSTLTVAGSNSTDFAADNSGCGTSLAAGASCSIAVTFTPAAAGTRSASLNIPTSAATLTISLSGTGAQSQPPPGAINATPFTVAASPTGSPALSIGTNGEMSANFFTSTSFPSVVEGIAGYNGSAGGLYLYSSPTGNVSAWKVSALASSTSVSGDIQPFLYPGDTYPGAMVGLDTKTVWWENPGNWGQAPASNTWPQQLIANYPCDSGVLVDIDGDGKQDYVCTSRQSRNQPAFIAFQNTFNSWTVRSNPFAAGDQLVVFAVNGISHVASVSGTSLYWYENPLDAGGSPRTAAWASHYVGPANEGVALGAALINAHTSLIVASNDQSQAGRFSSGLVWYEAQSGVTQSWTPHVLDSSYQDVTKVSIIQQNGLSGFLVAETGPACQSSTGCRISFFSASPNSGASIGSPYIVSKSTGAANQAAVPWQGGYFVVGANSGTTAGNSLALQGFELVP